MVEKLLARPELTLKRFLFLLLVLIIECKSLSHVLVAIHVPLLPRDAGTAGTPRRRVTENKRLTWHSPHLSSCDIAAAAAMGDCTDAAIASASNLPEERSEEDAESIR